MSCIDINHEWDIIVSGSQDKSVAIHSLRTGKYPNIPSSSTLLLPSILSLYLSIHLSPLHLPSAPLPCASPLCISPLPPLPLLQTSLLTVHIYIRSMPHSGTVEMVKVSTKSQVLVSYCSPSRLYAHSLNGKLLRVIETEKIFDMKLTTENYLVTGGTRGVKVSLFLFNFFSFSPSLSPSLSPSHSPSPSPLSPSPPIPLSPYPPLPLPLPPPLPLPLFLNSRITLDDVRSTTCPIWKSYTNSDRPLRFGPLRLCRVSASYLLGWRTGWWSLFGLTNHSGELHSREPKNSIPFVH